MTSRVDSVGLSGISGYPVMVECSISSGLPGFELVGLPDAAVRESRERVRAAIKNSGFRFPVSRITLNLAPAGTKKTGTLYDLPILLGILAAQELGPSAARAVCLPRRAEPRRQAAPRQRRAAHGHRRPEGRNPYAVCPAGKMRARPRWRVA